MAATAKRYYFYYLLADNTASNGLCMQTCVRKLISDRVRFILTLLFVVHDRRQFTRYEN